MRVKRRIGLQPGHIWLQACGVRSFCSSISVIVPSHISASISAGVRQGPGTLLPSESVPLWHRITAMCLHHWMIRIIRIIRIGIIKAGGVGDFGGGQLERPRR